VRPAEGLVHGQVHQMPHVDEHVGDEVRTYVALELADQAEPAVPREKSRFEMLLSVKEHEMHHRAQLMVFERLLGLVPHLTREREARMAAPPTGR